MQLSSDLTLYHPFWETADMVLINQHKLFNRLIDIFLIACAIGVKADKQIANDDIQEPLSSPKTIGRNTYQSAINTDLYDSLNFMLENSIITSECLNLDIDERLKLAFNPDYESKKFSPSLFLVSFANYGIVEIFSHINTNLPSLAVADDLYNYLNSLKESEYEKLLEGITLEELIESSK